MITAVAGIRADEANIPSSVRAILNPREIDFATPSLVSRVNTRRCAKVGNRRKDRTHTDTLAHIHNVRISSFIVSSENAIRFLYLAGQVCISRENKLILFLNYRDILMESDK